MEKILAYEKKMTPMGARQQETQGEAIVEVTDRINKPNEPEIRKAQH